MLRIREFIIALSLGGLEVILSSIVMYKALTWGLQASNTLLAPLTQIMVEWLALVSYIE